MTRRFVDLSVPLRAGIAPTRRGICRRSTTTTTGRPPEVVSFFPGSTVDDLPDGEGWAIERCGSPPTTASAPRCAYHYASMMDGGRRDHH